MRFRDPFLQLIDSEARRKIALFLLRHDSEMSEREISSLVGISHMTVNRILRDLEQWNLVSYKRVGRAHVWGVNRKSYAYDFLQALQQTIESSPLPLEALKKDIVAALPKKDLLKVVLFGSVASGEERGDSDIDIFILTRNAETARRLEDPLEKLSIQCLERFGNRLAPYILTEKQLLQKNNSRLMEEINKGIQLFPAGE